MRSFTIILQNLNNIRLIDVVVIACLLEIIVLFALLGIRFIYKSKDKLPRIKVFIIALGVFLLMYCANRTLFFLHELTFNPFVWSLDSNQYNQILGSNSTKARSYDIVWRISTGIGSYGLMIFLYALESKILEKKTHMIFTIFQGVTATLSIILGTSADNITIGRYILYFGLVPALAVPVCYFYLAKKASGGARIRAMGAGIGFLVFYIGMAINSSAGKAIFFYLMGINGIYISYISYCIVANIGLLLYIKCLQY